MSFFEKSLLSVFFLIPFAINGVLPHHETAFIAEKGSIDFLAAYSNYNTDRFWSRNGKSRKAFDTFKSHEGQAYLEYALLPCDALFLELGYVQTKESYSGDTKKFRDSEAGWKHLFWEQDCGALSSELRAIIPMGDRKNPIRYGEWGVQASVLYSKYFSRGWIDTLLGYRYYNGNPSDQIRAMGALGVDIYDWLQFIGTAELEYSLDNFESRFDRNLIAYNPNYRLLRIKGEIVIAPFCNYIALTLGVYRHVWGRSVGEGGGFYVGSWLYY